MTIDEAIAMLKFNNKHIADLGNDDLQQLAEWLEELKDYRDKNKMVVRVDVENMDSIKDKIYELSKYAESQYNKAIDDFAERLKEMANNSSTKYIRLSEKETITTYGVEQIAEQLKAGESE